jgi:hypothetical protein
VEFAEQVIGLSVLPWQRWLLIHALELLPTGRFRFRTVLVLVARQNGKTTLVEIKNLWKMFVLQVPLVIGTAQNLDISEESWDKAVEIVQGIPELNAEIAHVDKTNGKKALKLANGSRWKIAAASRKGGRGLSGDDVNMDELREHQSWDSWGAVTKTTMARPNAQVWAYSNAGDDKSIVLNDLQAKGRAAAAGDGADFSLGHFEWSAPDDICCTCILESGHALDCRLQDRRAWAAANPSLGFTVTEQALASALATDPEGVFRTECLCQRVQSLTPGWQVIPQAAWLRQSDPEADLEGRPAIGVYVPPDRSYCAIAAAGSRVGGGRLMELTGNDQDGDDYRPGTHWIVARLKQLERHKPSVLVIDDKAVADEAEKAGLVVHRANVSDVVTGCQLVYDGLTGAEPNLWHLGQQSVTDAAESAAKRKIGNSWAWERHDLTGDIATLGAASLAVFGDATPRVHRRGPRIPMAAYA